MKLNKIASALICISMIVGLFIQIMSILALTKSRIGKVIRKNLIGTMYDYMDESIDQAASRMPGFMKKIESISDSIEQ